MLLAASRTQPLCLVVEDLHWIDAETQEVLDSLVNGMVASRVLLLVTYRPEYRHAWGSKTIYSQVGLDALPAESAGELLDALLGHDPGLLPLKRLLVGQGNPFFLEEIVRMLVETSVLAGERGRYRLTHPVDAIAVPPTVQAMLAARIDRLPPEDRHLLQVASVVGKDVPLPLLQAIADLPDEAIRHGLDRLQAAEFLYETRASPGSRVHLQARAHPRGHLRHLLPDRRQALHARIVEAIERLNPDRLTGADERLAYHALRGEMWEKAVTYLRQAGARAVGRSANRDAVRCFEQALAALQHLPESRRTLEQAIDLRFDLRTALFPLGESERIFGYLGEAERLVRTLDDRRRLGQLCVYLCQDYWTGGYPTKAREFGQSAQAIAESLGDVPLQVTGNLYLSAAFIHTGDYRRAEALLSSVLQSARRPGPGALRPRRVSGGERALLPDVDRAEPGEVRGRDRPRGGRHPPRGDARSPLHARRRALDAGLPPHGEGRARPRHPPPRAGAGRALPRGAWPSTRWSTGDTWATRTRSRGGRPRASRCRSGRSRSSRR